KEIDDEVNTRRIDATTDILLLFVGSVGALLLFFGLSVILIQQLSVKISPKNEEKYFSWVSAKMAGHPIQDKKLNEILQKIAKEQSLYDIKFSIHCDSDLNAFALPGGRIVLNKGLLKEIKTEEGLAFVIGHEMGHLVKRHHMKGLGLGVVSIGLSFIFASDSTWIWNMIHSLLSSAYSREQEENADDYALKIMQKIYGSAQGAEEFFLIAQKRPEEKIHRALWFASSHPVTESRIQNIKQKSQAQELKEIVQSDDFAKVARAACR
ncbi:M48 family metallopeptidase, partial [bacterium]|nr:M48 family metallopeptidase [bacterium]